MTRPCCASSGCALLLLLGLMTFTAAAGELRASSHGVFEAEQGYGDGLCETCLVGGRVASDFLCDFTFINWAVSNLEEVACNGLADKDQCAQLIEVLLPLALEYARTTATPEALCSFAGLCKADVAAPPNKAKQLMHDLTLRGAASQCAQCRYVARTVKASTPTLSHEAVDAAAAAACLALPEDLAGGCTAMLKTSGSHIKDFIGFSRTCEIAGPCAWGFLEEQFGGAGSAAAAAPLTALARVIRRARGAPRPPPSLGDATSCDKCKLTVLEVRMVVNSATVQQSLVNASRAMCDHVAPYEDECRAMIDKYSPAAFSLIDKYLQPDTVCGSLLHMCPVKGQRQALLVPAKRTGSGYVYVQALLDRLQRLWQGRSWTQ